MKMTRRPRNRRKGLDKKETTKAYITKHSTPFALRLIDCLLHSLLQMERQCTCGKGPTVRRISTSSINKNIAYYACPDSKPKEQDFGCGFFRWENELKCPDDEKQTAQAAGISVPKKAGASCSSSSSPGPSSAGKGSGGLEANCPNCKLLLVKIKTLEAKLDLARRHEDPSQSATLQELLVGLDGILLDES